MVEALCSSFVSIVQSTPQIGELQAPVTESMIFFEKMTFTPKRQSS